MSCGYLDCYFRTQYPGNMCYDGYLWDADSCDDLMLSKTDFTYSDLLHQQDEYAGRSLNVYGMMIIRETYSITTRIIISIF